MIAPEQKSRSALFPKIDSDSMTAVKEQCGKFEESAVNWIRQNPAIALGIAATIGVTLGWLLKRR